MIDELKDISVTDIPSDFTNQEINENADIPIDGVQQAISGETKCVKFDETTDFELPNVDDDAEYLCRSESLFVNVDSASTNSISGEASAELCTQYSAAESDDLVKDINDEVSDSGPSEDLDNVSELNDTRIEKDEINEAVDNTVKQSDVILLDSEDLHDKVKFGLYECAESSKVENLNNPGLDDSATEQVKDKKSDETLTGCLSDEDNFEDCESVKLDDTYVSDKIVNSGKEVSELENKNLESQAENSFSEEFLDTLSEKLRLKSGIKSPSIDITDVSSAARRLKFRERRIDSDLSGCESYYSLDNSCLTGVSTGSPSVRAKKTLTWTPRILSDKRFGFGNSLSTSTFSDAASFYTAETSGTFYSARSFQLDSLDNFQTCDNFQNIDNYQSCNTLPLEDKNPIPEEFETCENLQGISTENTESKSKFSKAKDALVRGKEFVKTKFETYRKRLPVLGKTEGSSNNSRTFCYHPCGFSCSRVLKEISIYSLHDNTHHNNNEFQLKSAEDWIGDSAKHDKTEPGVEPEKRELENVYSETVLKNDEVPGYVTGGLVREASDRRTCPGVMLKRKLVGQDSMRLAARELVDLTNDCDIDSEDSEDEGLSFHRDMSE